MLRRLEGPPFRNEAYGKLHHLRGAHAYWQGDLSTEELSRLIDHLDDAGGLWAEARRGYLFVQTFDASFREDGALYRSRPTTPEEVDGALATLEGGPGLKKEWEPEPSSPGFLRRWFDRLEARKGMKRDAGDQMAVFSVESLEALRASQLDLELFFCFDLCFLRKNQNTASVVGQASMPELVAFDESLVSLRNEFDDRAGWYSPAERSRPDLHRTTTVAVGPGVAPEVVAAIDRFASTVR